MRPLLFVLAASLALLLWAAWAIARAILRHGRQNPQAPSEKPRELEDDEEKDHWEESDRP